MRKNTIKRSLSSAVLTGAISGSVPALAVCENDRAVQASPYSAAGQTEFQRRRAAARHAFEDRLVLRELGLLDP